MSVQILYQEQSVPLFDEELASELGADNYGMRQYVMAFLKTGPNRDTDADEAMKIQRAHLEYIRRVAKKWRFSFCGTIYGRWR